LASIPTAIRFRPHTHKADTITAALISRFSSFAWEFCHHRQIAPLYSNLKYIKGCNSAMADTLSWVEINANFHSFQVDWHDFAKTQKNLGVETPL